MHTWIPNIHTWIYIGLAVSGRPERNFRPTGSTRTALESKFSWPSPPMLCMSLWAPIPNKSWARIAMSAQSDKTSVGGDSQENSLSNAAPSGSFGQELRSRYTFPFQSIRGIECMCEYRYIHRCIDTRLTTSDQSDKTRIGGEGQENLLSNSVWIDWFGQKLRLWDFFLSYISERKNPYMN